MTSKKRVNSLNRDTRESAIGRRSRRLAFSILTGGLILAVLIAPFMSVESGLAADAVADDPCLTCPLETNSSAAIAANPELMAARRRASSRSEVRGADFYSLDHELAFFDRSAPASTAEERGADFYFLDHELAFFDLDSDFDTEEAPCGPWTRGMAC